MSSEDLIASQGQRTIKILDREGLKELAGGARRLA